MSATATETTLVIFRVWTGKPGTVIALFPGIQADNSGNWLSYEHNGQHGAASPDLWHRRTRPATPEEYAPLKRELEGRGYTLAVVPEKPTVYDIKAANPDSHFFTRNNLRFCQQTLKMFSVRWNADHCAWETVAARYRPHEAAGRPAVYCGESRHLWHPVTLKYLRGTPSR